MFESLFCLDKELPELLEDRPTPGGSNPANSDPISDELRKELVSNMSSALEARQTAVDWGVAKAVKNTNPYAHTGYKLASRLLRMDQPLIESLARELTSQGTIEGDALKKWLDGPRSRSCTSTTVAK